MAYITWNASKELGHAVVDREHRELIELVNRLVETLFDNTLDDGDITPVRRQRIEAAVDALGQATAAHFVSEEAIMQAVGYPGLADHRQQHADLVAQYGEFASHFHSPQGSSVALALRFLREWFEYHIEHYDLPMVRWIREQSATRG